MRFKRVYLTPKKSVLLLGPRGTGKSTFVRHAISPKLEIDLLKSTHFRQLSLNPSLLEDMTAHLKADDIVFIDEVQRIPELLNEVHRLLENRKLRFILTGSSARKLRQEGTNLLAGRALSKKFFPLTLQEVQPASINDFWLFGGLPAHFSVQDPSDKDEFLMSYVQTYLKEEIFQEGIVRSLEEFSAFVEIAGRYHGQILNFESIARELSKSGDTIKAWFQILKDTLVGYFIEAYPLHVFKKESKHPKFFWFDAGVSRAAQGFSYSDFPTEQRGFTLESVVLNELKVYLEIKGSMSKIYYYNVPQVGDIDFVVETQKKTMTTPSELVLIEVKASKKWEEKFENLGSKIHGLDKKSRIKKMVGFYLGNERLKTKSGWDVYPWKDFVKALWSGEII